MASAKKPYQTPKVINRRAHYDFKIIDTWEAGLQLTGTEVKSLRLGRGQLAGAYIIEKSGSLYIQGMHIAPYPFAKHLQHPEVRDRLLLLHKREIAKILTTIEKSSRTAIVLEVYANDRGYFKAKIATAQGQKKIDKRQTEKEKDWDREKQRLKKGDFS